MRFLSMMTILLLGAMVALVFFNLYHHSSLYLVFQNIDQNHYISKQLESFSLSTAKDIIKNNTNSNGRQRRNENQEHKQINMTDILAKAAAKAVAHSKMEEQELPKREQQYNMTASKKSKAHALITKQSNKQQEQQQHRVAGLSCQNFGGPSDDIASEMVYWNDIPSDSTFISPFKETGAKTKYLTFEPDEGGWNNIRMAMETAVATAHAMGRTLVMPPEQGIYLLGNARNNATQQKHKFTYSDFFHFESIIQEHPGIDIISTEEFIQREIISGNIKHPKTGKIMIPPTFSSLKEGQNLKNLRTFLRNLGTMPKWNFDKCIAVFPKGPAGQSTTTSQQFYDMKNEILNEKNQNRWNQYTSKPTPVNASVIDRMREALAHRTELCIYDQVLQQAPVIHFTGDNASGARMLVHFYALLFFEDWTHDLWSKRFIRDHVRYIDEIQCAAARVVHEMREKSTLAGYNGTFDSFHIRRGDFQYKETRIEASVIYDNTKSLLEEGYPTYIATDERNKAFFAPLAQHYKLFYLDDFQHVLEGFNTNYYGMLDQLIASRGRTFIGTYYSTFTGYIHRLRGHHYQKHKLPGYENGTLKGYYYVPQRHIHHMDQYMAISPPMWAREFPVGWRDIDKGIGSSNSSSRKEEGLVQEISGS